MTHSRTYQVSNPAIQGAFTIEAGLGANTDGQQLNIDHVTLSRSVTPAVACDDSSPCTTDSCDPVAGCAYAYNTNTCDDGNACTAADTCSNGACSGTPITAPPETQNVVAAADKVSFSWAAAPFAVQYDAVSGFVSALPVGPGGGDEICFDNLGGTTLVDAAVPAPDTGFWYLLRGANACGVGTFGTRSDGSARNTATCP